MSDSAAVAAEAAAAPAVPFVPTVPTASRAPLKLASQRPRRGGFGIWSAALGLLVAVGSVGYWNREAWFGWTTTPLAPTGWLTETVKRGSFTVTATERGTLDSQRNAVLVCKVEGTTTIIYLIPEGTMVKEGDLVCRLDASQLIDKEAQQKIAVTQAEAALEQATKAVEIQEKQNETDIATAKLKLELAEIDLEKYTQGEYIQQEKELLGQVSVTSEKLVRAKESYEFTERMLKKGFKNQNDLEAERLGVSEAELNMQAAQEKLRVLQKFTQRRQLAELNSNAREFRTELERVELKCRAAMEQKLADLSAKEQTAAVERNKLRRLESLIANCELRAPQDGQVVYANPRDSRGNDGSLIEEGATVRERQAIINLPDFEAMKVSARVHESRISLIRPGLQATVKVDAYPEEEFQADVDAISAVPLSSNMFNRDVKEYEASMKLLDSPEKVSKLRTGLTATVDIQIEQCDNVLYAPIQSVVSVAGTHFVYVSKNGEAERREVTIGRNNGRLMELLTGVEEGDEVILNPRTQFKQELAELESKIDQQSLERRKQPGGPGGTGGPGGRGPGERGRGGLSGERSPGGPGMIPGTGPGGQPGSAGGPPGGWNGARGGGNPNGGRPGDRAAGGSVPAKEPAAGERGAGERAVGERRPLSSSRVDRNLPVSALATINQREVPTGQPAADINAEPAHSQVNVAANPATAPADAEPSSATTRASAVETAISSAAVDGAAAATHQASHPDHVHAMESQSETTVSAVDPSDEEQKATEDLDPQFVEMDKDGDGAITPEEVDSRLGTTFSRVDRNSDQKIDAEEFAELQKKRQKTIRERSAIRPSDSSSRD